MEKSIIQIIQTRKSWRTFSQETISSDLLDEFKSKLKNSPSTPFGTTPRLLVLDQIGFNGQKSYKLGTYGMIQGANSFLCGVTKSKPHSMEDFGFLFEWAILQATDLGFGTCWLGGTLDRGEFGKATNLSDGEIIPCVSPIGYVDSKRGIVDSLIAFAARSSSRKEFSELFFDVERDHPYIEALEMVRLAPSASNRQPWRVFYRSDINCFDFYLKRTLLYDKMTPVDLQKIDMGIAMCHFEFSCKSLGLGGNWKFFDPQDALKKGLEYIVSWEIK